MDEKVITYPSSDCVFPSNANLIKNQKYVCFGEQRIAYFDVAKVSPLCSLKFKIKKIIYRDENTDKCFANVDIISYQNGKEIPNVNNLYISGYFYNIYKEAEYDSLGYWKNQKDKNDIFIVTEHSNTITSTENQIINFIKFITKGMHLSSKKIFALVDYFKENTIDAIKKYDINYVLIMKNLKFAKKIQQAFLKNEEEEKAFYFMILNNIPSCTAVKVLKKYKNLSNIVIKNNPYILIDFDISIKTIDNFANKGKFKYNDQKRIEGFILSYVEYQLKNNGDVYIDLDDLIDGSDNDPALLNDYILRNGVIKGDILNKDVKSALNNLVKNNKIIIEQNLQIKNKSCVYLSYYANAENAIVSRLKEMTKEKSPLFLSQKTINSNITRDTSIILDSKQKQAVIMAINNKISIITGGPGTGKTQTINTIVRVLFENYTDIDIQLCAPTGKASRRMSEVMNYPAETIHKKLNYLPTSNDDTLREINCDYLIVDESSMIDIDLFYKLLLHLNKKTCILFVGDYNQIPSVGPGLILRDMISSNIIPFIKLTTIFRQKKKSKIVYVADKILENDIQDILCQKDFHDFKYISTLNDNETLKTIINFVNNAKNKNMIDINNFQILTPINNGILGTIGLNKSIRDILNNRTTSSTEEIYISPTKIFRVNDKVIQTKNNYDLNVYNGSIGVVSFIDFKNKEMYVDYDGMIIKYKIPQMRELNLAYAITIHKSQGSEFDYVIVPLSNNHLSVINRNILYTALTRAKKQIIFVGVETAFITAVNKNEQFLRKSQIKTKLILK